MKPCRPAIGPADDPVRVVARAVSPPTFCRAPPFVHDVSDSPAVGDHLRPVDGSRPAGIYRVVGAGDPLALLRVTDEQDRRRATGDLVSVSRESLSGFEPAADPDAGFTPVAWVRGLLSGSYWGLRMILDWLRSR